jgi:hypothetical protein
MLIRVIPFTERGQTVRGRRAQVQRGFSCVADGTTESVDILQQLSAQLWGVDPGEIVGPVMPFRVMIL